MPRVTPTIGPVAVSQPGFLLTGTAQRSRLQEIGDVCDPGHIVSKTEGLKIIQT